MMNSKTHWTGGMLSRFRRDESGVAAIEFAFIAPLLVVFLLGTTTATQSLWAHGKVAQTGSVIGDLIAQETQLDDTGFESILNAAPVMMEPFPLGDIRIEVIAAVACHADPTQAENSVPSMFVAWSNAWTPDGMEDSDAQPGQDLVDAPTELSIEDGDYLIKTTVTYTYKPTITQEAGHEIEMGEVAYHQPRDDRPISYPSREGAEETRDCKALMNR